MYSQTAGNALWVIASKSRRPRYKTDCSRPLQRNSSEHTFSTKIPLFFDPVHRGYLSEAASSASTLNRWPLNGLTTPRSLTSLSLSLLLHRHYVWLHLRELRLIEPTAKHPSTFASQVIITSAEKRIRALPQEDGKLEQSRPRRGPWTHNHNIPWLDEHRRGACHKIA